MNNDIEDASRYAAERAAHYWFTASAGRVSPTDPRVTFEARTWWAGKPLSYTRSYPLQELKRVGARPLASAFVEIARSHLPRGKPQPES